MPVTISGTKYNGVSINGVCFPVSETSATSQVLFRVSSEHGQTFYSCPEVYYDTMRPRPRNTEKNVQYEREGGDDWAQKRQAFLDYHKAWYARVDNIKKDTAGWLAHIHSKLDPRGYNIDGDIYIV